MKETVERIGVCQSKISGFKFMFNRVKVRQSRKYRIYTCPGEINRSILLDPSVFMEGYETVQEYKPIKRTDIVDAAERCNVQDMFMNEVIRLCQYIGDDDTPVNSVLATALDNIADNIAGHRDAKKQREELSIY